MSSIAPSVMRSSLLLKVRSTSLTIIKTLYILIFNENSFYRWKFCNEYADIIDSDDAPTKFNGACNACTF